MLVKCQYCKEKAEKVKMECIEKQSGNKIVRKYYHKDCYKKKQARDLAKDKFIKYTGFLGVESQIYVAFKKIKEKGLDEYDILYTINYIINNQHVLNFPMGLLYYIDRAMRQKHKEAEILAEKERVIKNLSNVKIKPLKYRNDTEKQEQKNEFDISDYI